MTACTGLDLFLDLVRIKVDQESFIQELGVSIGKLFPCPADMKFAGSMAGLAAHIDLGPGGLIKICFNVISFSEIGAVAFPTSRVPVLKTIGPMVRIIMGSWVIGIEMKPALISCIPGDRQGLESTVRHLDQVLLKGIYAQGVSDLKILKGSVRAVGIYEKTPISFKKNGKPCRNV